MTWAPARPGEIEPDCRPEPNKELAEDGNSQCTKNLLEMCLGRLARVSK